MNRIKVHMFVHVLQLMTYSDSSAVRNSEKQEVTRTSLMHYKGTKNMSLLMSVSQDAGDGDTGIFQSGLGR